MSAGDSSNYDSLMSVRDLINALYNTGDTNAKVFLGILTPEGNNPRTKCSIRAVHGDAWKLPAVEIVGQPLSDEKPAYDEDAYRARADRGTLLTILRGLTDDMDEQEGGDTHIAGHTVRFVRDMERRVRADRGTAVDEKVSRGDAPVRGLENVKADPDNCKCPKCQPRQWLVEDLVREINERDDALDELAMAAELVAVYQDARAFDRLRAALKGWREASGDPR